MSYFDEDSNKIPAASFTTTEGVLRSQIANWGKGERKNPTHRQTNHNSSMLIIAFCFSKNKVLRLLIGEMFTPGDSRLTDVICSNDGHRCNREVPRGPRYSPDFIPSFRESGWSRIPGGSVLRAVEYELSSVSSRESKYWSWSPESCCASSGSNTGFKFIVRVFLMTHLVFL